MIPPELRSRLRRQLERQWRAGFGPAEYNPPSSEQCEALGFTLEEGVAFYDECLAKSGMVEIRPGFWDWKKPL